MARERFAAPGRDLSTDVRPLRLTNFLAFWGQQSRSVNVGEGGREIQIAPRLD